MTTLSCSLRSPSRFPPFAPFLSPRSRLLRCLFPAHVREKTISYFDEETTGKARFLFVLLFRGGHGTKLRREDNNLTSQEARKAYMEGIHVGFARRICTDASSKPLPIATYCLRTFHRLGTNPTVKTALHLPWSDFRASFGAEDAGIQEYSKDDKPEITGNRPCQAARIPFMYAPVFSP